MRDQQPGWRSPVRDLLGHRELGDRSRATDGVSRPWSDCALRGRFQLLGALRAAAELGLARSRLHRPPVQTADRRLRRWLRHDDDQQPTFATGREFLV